MILLRFCFIFVLGCYKTNLTLFGCMLNVQNNPVYNQKAGAGNNDVACVNTSVIHM